ncbi:transmembrane protein 50A [Sitodiplosis mosellana]|uniref:transmembrane protein 50A n=1 Tax=Sitodiplosis mosellana TaxID=263140 RepID=UPI0024438C45|nr:transmembrane protein 50A [Sitodiplosis mosellana]
MSIWDSLTSCFWFSAENQRNTFASILAGVLFFTGWWFLIDAISVYGETTALQIILGIMGTASLIMVNSVSQAQINGDVAFNGGCLETRGARIWIFVGFVLGFAAIIAAVWTMIVRLNGSENKSSWPAISVLLQNVFIFLGSIVFKFGRSEESY